MDSSDSPAAVETETLDTENHQQYEATPLMYSRCSSLDSLASCSQPSIHSDRISVYSDVRMMSGLISPSDLPDSPSETVPPSPSPAIPYHHQLLGRFQDSFLDDSVDEVKIYMDEGESEDESLLSPLTIESPGEPANYEEDLLEQCIRAGMPKKKLKRRNA